MLPLLCAVLLWLSLAFLEPVLASNDPLATWNEESWTLSHGEKPPLHGNYRHRLSLANGYLGINSAAVGPFWERSQGDYEADEAHGDDDESFWCNGTHDEQNGWPLRTRRQAFATVAGFYGALPKTNRSNFEWLQQYGSESIISGIPHWAGLYVEQSGVASDRSILNGSVSLDDIHNFSTSLNIRGAQMHWGYRWAPPGGVPILVNYTMFVNKLFVNKAAVRLSLKAERGVNVTVYDVLEGECAVRSTPAGKDKEEGHPTIWSGVNAQGVNATAFVYSTLSVHGLGVGPDQPFA
jgi:trehalose/maltose hydrolase-like predicted phosphorylase